MVVDIVVSSSTCVIGTLCRVRDSVALVVTESTVGPVVLRFCAAQRQKVKRRIERRRKWIVNNRPDTTSHASCTTRLVLDGTCINPASL
jgi:hypothetical protein